MGKPDPVIYDVALDMLQLPKESVLAIGDSLQHDIQGNSRAAFVNPLHIIKLHLHESESTPSLQPKRKG